MSKEKKTDAARAVRRLGRYPHKVGINLNMHEKRTGTVLTLVIGCAAIVLLAGLVAKFGVIDQYRRLSQAEEDYAQVHRQYETVQEELSDYDKVLNEYRSYSMDWTGEDDTGLFSNVSRQDVLDLIETEMMPNGTVNSIQVLGNSVLVNMSGMTLARISEMFRVIEQNPIVDRVELNVAETDKDRTDLLLDFSLSIALKTEEVGE